MNEIVQSILSSTAGIYISIGLILYLIIAIKKGTISFHGKGLDIGKSKDEERTIIRDQWELISTLCEGTMSLLPQHLQNDKAKYIISKVEDVYQKACVLNAISTNESYLLLKYSLVLNTITKRATDPYFKSEEFLEYLKSFNKDMISQLVQLRIDREKNH